MRKVLSLILMLIFLCVCVPAQTVIAVSKEATPKKTVKKVSKPSSKQTVKASKTKKKAKSSVKTSAASKPLPKKTVPPPKGKQKIQPGQYLRPTEEAWSFEMTSEEAAASSEALRKDGGKKLWFEIGGRVGLFAAANGAFGELRFPLLRTIGPAATSLRLSGGLAQDEETSRRYVPVSMDGILNFPAGYITG